MTKMTYAVMFKKLYKTRTLPKVWNVYKFTKNMNHVNTYFDNFDEAVRYYDKQCLSKNWIGLHLTMFAPDSSKEIYSAGELKGISTWRDVSDPKWLALQKRR